MKTTRAFELDILKRDWIGGISGNAFLQQTQECIARIEATIGSATARGVLIVELDPVKFAAAFFAAVYVGVPVILANPKWRRLEWEQLGKQIHPAIVFGQTPIREVKRSAMNNLQSGTILIPTGGSSGKLKLAIHTWDTLTAACKGFSSFLGAGPIHCCCVLPLYHVSGLMQLVRSFVSGGQVVFTDIKTLQAGHFPKVGPDRLCLSLVPTQLQRLLEREKPTDWLKTLRAIFLGGAPLSPTLQARAQELSLPVAPTYGMTETAAMVTALPADEFLSGNTSVGRSLEHAKIQVVHEDGSTGSPDKPGRIRIQSSSLCLGYHGIRSKISEEGFFSDDEGYLDAQGHLHVIGRRDRIIISGGEKIDPHEIEQAMIKNGIAREALAIGWPDPEWGQRLVAFYIPKDDTDGVEDLEQKLRSNLVNYKIPKQIIQVEQLPLDERSKINHRLVEYLIKR